MTLNKVQLIGHLGNDVEMKFTATGKEVCTLSVATNENWTDSNGQKQTKTTWHRVVCWQKLAKNCATYLKKGRAVYVEGRLDNRKWEKDGVTHWTTEIVAQNVQFLGVSNASRQTTQQASVEEDFSTNLVAEESEASESAQKLHARDLTF
jgi:single-strand DNA-binding protein